MKKNKFAFLFMTIGILLSLFFVPSAIAADNAVDVYAVKNGNALNVELYGYPGEELTVYAVSKTSDGLLAGVSMESVTLSGYSDTLSLKYPGENTVVYVWDENNTPLCSVVADIGTVYYGLVTGMYKSLDGSAVIAKIITADGKIAAYECKSGYNSGVSATAEQSLRESLTGSTYSSYPISKDSLGVSERIISGKTFVSYRLSGEKITNVTPLGNNVVSLLDEYTDSSSRIGSYKISDDVSQMLCLENYIWDDEVSAITVSDLVDGNMYSGFMYKKPGSSYCNFVCITDGMYSIGVNTPLAVVQKRAGTTLAKDGQECTKYIVAVNGQENQEVLFDTALCTAFGEGDVIQYVAGSKGYVDQAAKYNFVLGASAWAVDDGRSAYRNLYDMTVANNDFNYMIIDANNVFYGLNASTLPKPEDSITFGIVYKQQNIDLELFLNQVAGESGIGDTSCLYDFSTSGANLYKVDYTNKTKYRVEVGGISQSSSIFTTVNLGGGTYVRNPNTDTVNWANVRAQNIAPSFALVRIYGNKEADIVYYTGEF